MAKIIILGGGIGGIVSANRLRKKLGSDHKIILVEKLREHVFYPSLPWVMAGLRKPGKITYHLSNLLLPGIEIINGNIQEINPKQHFVQVNRENIPFDYLVVSLGADLMPQTIPGLREKSHNLYSLEGAVSARNELQQFQKGRIIVLISSMPYKCPAAPYESAMLLEAMLRQNGIRKNCKIEIFTPETQPMPVAGKIMGDAVVSLLSSKDIFFHPQHSVKSIEPSKKEILFSDGSREAFDLLLAIPPHSSPEVVKTSGLANEAGWIPANKFTLETSFKNIYALGDVTSIPLANGKALPKAGVFAHRQAEIIGDQIASIITGEKIEARFDGLGYCWIETGNGQAGFASGNFYAEPDPVISLPSRGRLWHLGKVLFEQYWLSKGLKHHFAKYALNLGAKILNVPASL